MKISQQVISILAVLFMAINVSAQDDAVTPEVAAEAAFQAQQWQAAAGQFEQLTSEDPTNGSYWFRLGQSHLNLLHYEQARNALNNAKNNPHESVPPVAVLVNLARAQAASGSDEAAIATLHEIAESPARPFLAVSNATEFERIKETPEFVEAVNRLRPCMSEANRAFDFWVGEWEVTSPARAGWTARSSITLGNGGCSVHEDYLTQGGYAGRSINFYDTTKEMWHQTWVDNRGIPIYLEGNAKDGAMILSDETSRVTWSLLPDGRVRQHWESTSDGGETYTTAFDGYYQRKAETE